MHTFCISASNILFQSEGLSECKALLEKCSENRYFYHTQSSIILKHFIMKWENKMKQFFSSIKGSKKSFKMRKNCAELYLNKHKISTCYCLRNWLLFLVAMSLAVVIPSLDVTTVLCFRERKQLTEMNNAFMKKCKFLAHTNTPEA